MTRTDRIALGSIVLAVVFARLVSIYSFYLYDDAFITFRYAANLAHGHGFVYNLGQKVQGITTPLWGLILALPAVFGSGLEMASRILGLLIEVAIAAVVFCALKRERLGRAAVLSGFLFAVDIYLAKTSVSGMESSLFLLGTVAATALAVEGRKTLAGFLAGLCFFLRPEALLFAAVLLGFVWWEERRFPWKAVLAGVAIILAGTALQAAYYGDWIPQSVRGKFALPRTYEALWSLVLFPKKDPLQALLTITALLSLPYAWRVSRFARIYAAWTLLLFAVWAVTGAHLWMWYCVPVFFVKTVLTGIGVAHGLESRMAKRTVARLFSPVLLLVAVVILWSALGFALGPDKMETNVYSKIRAWSAGKNFDSQRACAMDFGAFGYYSGMTILDEPGLVYPPALSKYHADMRTILLAERPEWAFVTCYQENIRMMRSDSVARMYEPLQRFSVFGETNPAPPLDSVRVEWERDFILFHRRPSSSG